MDEAFLHYVWKFQYFYKHDLTTTSGLPVHITRPGIHNHNAGPDFTNAKVTIGNIEWSGSVEIHIHEKDWYQHQHQKDRAYDNVILHVVWSADPAGTFRSDGTSIPVIKLCDRIDQKLLLNYEKLISSDDNIPCSHRFHKAERLKVFEMLDRVVVERLQTKANDILIRLRKNDNDWEETCFQLLASNFGFKVNKTQFIDLATRIPCKLLQKHADNLTQLEALLFGMAGFLEDDVDDAYFERLKKEFRFLCAKYKLSRILSRHHWKFLRLRPANFPTIRMAQLAHLLSEHQKLFSMFLNVKDVKILKGNLRAVQSEYWQRHYDFGKTTENKIGGLGEESINNIIINTCVPLLAAYSIEKDQQEYLDRALIFLQRTNSEKNKITNAWKNLGMRISSAFDSQASIELMNSYCLQKKCLDCSIGVSILNE